MSLEGGRPIRSLVVGPSQTGVEWLDKGLDDVPDVFSRIAKFAARNAGT